jgi:hypothetical protein
MLMICEDNARDIGEKKGKKKEKRPFTPDHGVFVYCHLQYYIFMMSN